MIYVAETTSDLGADRDNIRRELQQHGCQVLPDQPLPMNARALEQAVRADLRETRLSVHLVGAHYGVIPEMERNRSSVRMQLDLAAERCGDATFSRLIWMPIGLRSEDERQQALINELQRSAQAVGSSIAASLSKLSAIMAMPCRPV